MQNETCCLCGEELLEDELDYCEDCRDCEDLEELLDVCLEADNE